MALFYLVFSGQLRFWRCHALKKFIIGLYLTSKDLIDVLVRVERYLNGVRCSGHL